MRKSRAVLSLALALAACAPPALAAFPQDPPDDPEYAAAERDCLTTSVNEEQHYLYAGASRCTPQAKVPGGAAGMSVDAAWREVTAGRPDVTIAYLEGGINWHLPSARDVVEQVFLNARELPAPTTPVDDGRLNARDYADSRDANANGYVDPEDLIVRFSDGTDGDRNGYVDDISGWDFYDDQNDPATVDAAYAHANNQLRKAAAEGDNGLLGIGVCPGCTIVPIKAGAEALDRSDDLAQAFNYAADIGASVVASCTADLGYSSFMRDTVERLWREGIVMVAASNDFDSTDHQGGMFHPFVVPANGMVTNTVGIPGPAANALTTTFEARSGKTSWGTKNLLTVSTQEGSTSQSVPIHGGVYALIAAAGRKAVDEGRLARRLSAAEILQVARATATDVMDTEQWPSRAGWDLHYGYGRPDVLRATRAVMAGEIPPVGFLTSPDWYALIDPAQARRVVVRGRVEAPRSSAYRWVLEAAPGAEPADGAFTAIGEGRGTRPFEGRLGAFDPRTLPDGFAERAMALSRTKVLETNERYTVTLRLRVTDAQGRVGEDRRAIAVHHDRTWLGGFPKRIGPGGEAQPQLVDLQGRGRLAAVFGDSDGRVHAIDMVTGSELPGWPARTRKVQVTRRHAGVDPRNEPVIANAAVGDLDGTGRLSVVVTSSSGRVYAFDRRGRLRRGWPQALDAGLERPPIPRPRQPFTRLRHLGAFAPPVLVDLDRDGRLDVVQSGWDGHLHAFDTAGRDLPGWPVAARVTTPPPAGYVRLDDRKLQTSPAVAQLDADPEPELVVRTQQFDTLGTEIQPAGTNYTFAFDADGSVVEGWPIAQRSLVVFHGSAQEFITEGANAPSAADVDGDGRDELAISTLFSPTTLFGADGRERALYGPVPDLTLGLLEDPQRLLGSGALPTDVQVSFTTSGAFGRFGDGVVYAEPGSGAASVAGALLLTGSGLPIVNTVRVHGAGSGVPRTGFPAVAQGLNFLGGPVFADVTGDGRPELLTGGDSSVLHAFDDRGRQAPGFPKFHTGWSLYAPAVGDVDGDGRVEVVQATREGYLMAWRTPGYATRGDGGWWSFRHDERNTGRRGTDSRPPSPAGDVRLDGTTVRFTAPGDDWRAGRADRVVVRAFRAGRSAPATLDAEAARPGARQEVAVPTGTRRVEVQAVDDAGNRGAPVRAASRR